MFGGGGGGGAEGAPASADYHVDVSYLLSAAAVSLECVSKCGLERADRCLPRPAHQLVSFKLLSFSDTKEFEYRNARLSH